MCRVYVDCWKALGINLSYCCCHMRSLCAKISHWVNVKVCVWVCECLCKSLYSWTLNHFSVVSWVLNYVKNFFVPQKQLQSVRAIYVQHLFLLYIRINGFCCCCCCFSFLYWPAQQRKLPTIVSDLREASGGQA